MIEIDSSFITSLKDLLGCHLGCRKILVKLTDDYCEKGGKMLSVNKNPVQIVTGNLLDSKEQCIIQQVNATTINGRGYGLSKQIFIKYPHANVYYANVKRIPGMLLLRGDNVKTRCVINLVGQQKPGKPTTTETKAMREAWFKAALDLLSRSTSLTSVAFPYKIGSGLAGGNWTNYLKMIQDFANSRPKVKVVIYKLPGVK